MLLKLRFGLLYVLYGIKLLWYRIVLGAQSEELLVEKVAHPRIAMKLLGIEIGKNCRIKNGLTLYNYSKGNLSIGNNVHIGKGAFLDLTDKINISDNCTISMGAKVLTHINVGDSALQKNYPSFSSAIKIEESVYLGADSIVLHSVNVIAKESLLASNSTLSSDTKAYGIYAGNPAVFKKSSRT